MGRTLLPSDDSPAAPPVVVISESYWRRRFNGDPDVIGRVVRVNGIRAEIVGVIALPFRGMYLPNLAPTSVWVTLDRFAPILTIDLRLDYLRPAANGETIVARCECVKLTRRIAFVRGIAHGAEDERPIALSAATFMLNR